MYNERYICAVRHDHPIAQQTELTLEQFYQLEQGLISYHGGSFSGVTDKGMQAMGPQRNISLSVQNFIVLPKLLAQSDLLTVLPERLIANLPNLKCFEPPLEIQDFTKNLIWYERTHKAPVYRRVRELIEKACLVEEK